MSGSLLIRAVVAASFVMAGCGTTDAGDVVADETVDEGALTASARSLVGKYVSTSGAARYAQELELEPDGTFRGAFNPELFAVRLACVRAPCLAEGDGKWNVSNGRLALSVKHLLGSSVSRKVTFTQRVTGEGDDRELHIEPVRNGHGEQTLRRDTEEDEPEPRGACAGKRCGERCSTCIGQPNCGMMAGPMYCNDEGRCARNVNPLLCR